MTAPLIPDLLPTGEFAVGDKVIPKRLPRVDFRPPFTVTEVEYVNGHGPCMQRLTIADRLGKLLPGLYWDTELDPAPDEQ